MLLAVQAPQPLSRTRVRPPDAVVALAISVRSEDIVVSSELAEDTSVTRDGSLSRKVSKSRAMLAAYERLPSRPEAAPIMYCAACPFGTCRHTPPRGSKCGTVR